MLWTIKKNKKNPIIVHSMDHLWTTLKVWSIVHVHVHVLYSHLSGEAPPVGHCWPGEVPLPLQILLQVPGTCILVPILNLIWTLILVLIIIIFLVLFRFFDHQGHWSLVLILVLIRS